MHNRRAQVGIFTLLFLDIVFIVLWALVLGGLLTTFGAAAISDNSLTGLEAWFYGNLNLIVFIGFLLTNLAFTVGGGR